MISAVPEEIFRRPFCRVATRVEMAELTKLAFYIIENMNNLVMNMNNQVFHFDESYILLKARPKATLPFQRQPYKYCS